MNSRGQLIFGILLLAAGLVFLAGELFDINLWSFCWPAALIVLGLWLLLRPRLAADAGVDILLFGDVDRYGDWRVTDREIWMLIGDVRLDLTRAQIPPGETTIRVYGLIGDVDVHLPSGVGASVVAAGLVNEAELFDQKSEVFFTPIRAESEGYPSAESRVCLETYLLIGDVKVVAI